MDEEWISFDVEVKIKFTTTVMKSRVRLFENEFEYDGVPLTNNTAPTRIQNFMNRNFWPTKAEIISVSKPRSLNDE